jgi:hypothetical protein
VARHLHALGLAVQHILADGRLESHADALSRLLRQLNLPEHDLFRSPEDVLEDAYRIQGEGIAYYDAEISDADLETTRSTSG